jgi:hypothetical protein
LSAKVLLWIRVELKFHIRIRIESVRITEIKFAAGSPTVAKSRGLFLLGNLFGNLLNDALCNIYEGEK